MNLSNPLAQEIKSVNISKEKDQKMLNIGSVSVKDDLEIPANHQDTKMLYIPDDIRKLSTEENTRLASTEKNTSLASLELISELVNDSNNIGMTKVTSGKNISQDIALA